MKTLGWLSSTSARLSGDPKFAGERTPCAWRLKSYASSLPPNRLGFSQ